MAMYHLSVKFVSRKHDSIISPQNPHAHILITTRPITKDGFAAKKNREWESPQNVRNWREAWAKAQNREFERKGLEVRVSHESLAKQGLEREPTIHLGHAAAEMERRGIQTERGDENRAIEAKNQEREGRSKERDRQRYQERVRNRERDREREQNRDRRRWQEREEREERDHRQPERERGRPQQPEQSAPARHHNRIIFQQLQRGEYQPMAQSNQKSGGKPAASSPSPATPAVNPAGRGHNFDKFTHTPPLSSPTENDSHSVRTDIFGFGYASQKLSDADIKRQEQEEAERREREERERKEQEEQKRKEREERQERRRRQEKYREAEERVHRRLREREQNRSRDGHDGHDR